MSWRIVQISERAKLDLRLGYLTVRGETVNKIHISEISILIIENTAVSITAALLAELVKKKVKVIFCDEKRNPLFETSPYYGSHDTSRKVRSQISWSRDIKESVWTRIVEQKIFNQMRHLESRNLKESEMLEGYLSEIEHNDSTNREGHSAKVYFNALFGKDFSRERESPLNAALNYGYGVILSAVNRHITASGYLTQLGICHDNIYNMFNFGSDLMEPLRPLVDKTVYDLKPENFGKEEKVAVLSILNSECYIDGKKHFLNNAISLYCRSVFDSLDNEDISYLRFIEYEL
ncbi:MAG: type II CRISPR-associated endonuclease Cas1 [Ruminococcaceae bacterium]|nr:type II CRISPR-associated endonuclease Cas1 [Oscillospiraceae bacterium]